METNYSIRNIIKQIKSEYLLHCRVPQDYSSGLPLLVYRNENLCMIVPYLRYRITGKKNGTLVFQIKYAVTVDLPPLPDPEAKSTEQALRIVRFEDLAYDPRFKDFEFNMPVGLFKHQAIIDLTKKEYNDLRDELFTLYDKLAVSLISGYDMDKEDVARMRELFGRIVEPSTLKVYKMLDRDFYDFIIG